MRRFWLVSIMTLITIIGMGWTNGSALQKEIKAPVQTTEQNILPKHKHTAKCENTAAEPVQIICILDRSGSMRSLAEEKNQVKQQLQQFFLMTSMKKL